MSWRPQNRFYSTICVGAACIMHATSAATDTSTKQKSPEQTSVTSSKHSNGLPKIGFHELSTPHSEPWHLRQSIFVSIPELQFYPKQSTKMLWNKQISGSNASCKEQVLKLLILVINVADKFKGGREMCQLNKNRKCVIRDEKVVTSQVVHITSWYPPTTRFKLLTLE